MKPLNPSSFGNGPSGTPAVPLAQLLHAAGAELAAQPPPSLPAAVLAALPAAAAKPPLATGRWLALPGWSLSWTRWTTVAAACSVMLVSVTVLLMLSATPPGAESGALPGGFVPVAPQERWSRLGDEGGAAWVVTTELPQTRLAGYGLPFDPARAADTVRAELLMRATGEVLAVRVLY